jgi:hypothetical protein
MRATRSRTITSLLVAVGAFAVSAMIAAPTAVADPNTTDCQPGQVVINGQCNVPDNNANLPAPQHDTGGSGTGSGGAGTGSGGHGR